jgi:hypothetical protein
VAIYEYELKAIIDAISEASHRRVKIRVLYHAKVGDLNSPPDEPPPGPAAPGGLNLDGCYVAP